jgi:class 3 adenylate cyclase
MLGMVFWVNFFSFLAWALAYGVLLYLFSQFVVMVFYPGTGETAWFFSFYRDLKPLLDSINSLLTLPVQWLSDLLVPFLPKGTASVFPVADAGDFLQQCARWLAKWPGTESIGLRETLLTDDYNTHYPGKFLWLLPIAGASWFLAFTWTERRILTAVTKTMYRKWAADDPHYYQPLTDFESFQHSPGPLQDSPQHITPAAASPAVPFPVGSQPDTAPEVRHILDALKAENARLYQQQAAPVERTASTMSPKLKAFMQQHHGKLARQGSVEQPLTLMSCSLFSLNGFSANHAPQETAQYLNQFQSWLGQVVQGYQDGILLKGTGQTAMAYWGFPLPNTDHAYTATRAAIHLLQAVEQWNRENAHQPYQLGIGIATGPVVIGNIAASDCQDFTLVGEVVTLATRIQEVTPAMQTQILLSESTYHALQNRLLCKQLGPISLPGHSESLLVFEPHFYR